MNGGKNKQPLGYTIIEVMIVLAVSGVMFLIAATYINGKQERTSFTSGVNDMASSIQDTITQVTDGKFSDASFGCIDDGSAPPMITIPGSGQYQGQAPQCVFLGKFLHFHENNQSNNYEIFSLAANRLNASQQPATQLTGVAADVYTAPVYSPGIIDLTTQQATSQNLSITKVIIQDISGVTYTNTWGFGFVQGLGAADSGNNSFYATGIQTPSLVYAPALNNSNTNEATAAGNLRGPNKLVRAQMASICLTDGTQYALVTVGGNNSNQLSAGVQRLGATAC